LDDAKTVVDRLETVVHDAERLVSLHSELLQSELRQSAAQALPALAGMGTGAGLAAAGGLLGSFAAVHALHRFTRLPLWGCYGLVAGLLGAAGVGLLGSGVRQISEVSFIPRETIATLKEDLEWAKGKTK
jgi:hypothetical protein